MGMSAFKASDRDLEERKKGSLVSQLGCGRDGESSGLTTTLLISASVHLTFKALCNVYFRGQLHTAVKSISRLLALDSGGDVHSYADNVECRGKFDIGEELRFHNGWINARATTIRMHSLR